MTAARQGTATCERCGALLEHCAVCGEGGCLEPLCYPCVRVAIRQEMPQPHEHGG